MSLVKNTAPHLPYLRRFARALYGSQKSGDAYVVAVLEALVADPASFDTLNDPRVELFTAFCRMWNSLEINLAKTEFEPDELMTLGAPAGGDDAAAAPGLPAHGGGGFLASEIAYILGRSEAEVSAAHRPGRPRRSPSRSRPTCSSSRTSR